MFFLFVGISQNMVLNIRMYYLISKLISTICKVTPVEETNLSKSNGNYVTEAVLNDQND